MASSFLPRYVCALTLAVSLGALAQSADDISNKEHLKQVPPQVPAEPFAPTSVTGRSLEFRPATAMSQQDRLIAANAESSIAEHAQHGNIDFAGGDWSYEQIVCPALPNHLFLQYKRAAGTGSETVFSASIPRNGEGRVRIIPVRRRGYSLFSPAPINALTISTFNHIRAEEPEPQRGEGWLGNALCYAALAGAHPQVPAPDALPTLEKPVVPLSAVLQVKNKDGEVIQFADEATMPKPTLWTMTFTAKGKLVKARHEAAQTWSLRPVPTQTPAVMKPVPGEQNVELRSAPKEAQAAWRPVPAGK